MFFFLVTPSGAKTPYQTADLAELSATSVEHARELLEQLTKPRVVARLEHPERYEVYHDVLAPAVLRWRIDFEKEQDRAEAERKAEEERQRAEREAAAARRFRWLALALACSLVAAVVAAWSFHRQRQRAYAAGLAASSLQESTTGDPERGVLLGLEAYDAFQPAEPAVERALYTAVEHSRVRATFSGHGGAVNALALARAANLIVTVGDDGSARVWDSGGKGGAGYTGGSGTADLGGGDALGRSRGHGRLGWEREGVGPEFRAGDFWRAGERASERRGAFARGPHPGHGIQGSGDDSR